MRIVLLLVIVLLFLIIFSNKTIPSYLKIIFTLSLLVIFSAGYLYEKNMEKDEAVNIKKVEAFRQGTNLLCRDKIVVNSKMFSYLSGTMTFAPKLNNIKGRGLIISVTNCRIDR